MCYTYLTIIYNLSSLKVRSIAFDPDVNSTFLKSQQDRELCSKSGQAKTRLNQGWDTQPCEELPQTENTTRTAMGREVTASCSLPAPTSSSCNLTWENSE